VGKKIPSQYLRLFSDGTVECSTVKFDEHDTSRTKKGRLKPEELAEANAIINDPSLRDVKGRYVIDRLMIDSWMDWDIRIRSPKNSQRITISFAGASQMWGYPQSLSKLGCLILKLRGQTYGDSTAYYSPACKNIAPPATRVHQRQ
jgi:hypothetical protein